MSAAVRLAVTLARSLDDVDGRAYDALVGSSPTGHYSQARAWADVATAGRPLRARYFLARRGSETVGAALVLRATLGGVVPLPAALVERGPVCRAREDLPDVLAGLARAARRRGIFRLTAMPYVAGDHAASAEAELARCGYRLDHGWDGAHARTLRLDLTKDELFAGKDGKSLRQRVRQAERAGVETRLARGPELSELAQLYTTLMADQGKRAKPPAFFAAIDRLMATSPASGAAFVSRVEGRAISAAFVARHGDIATWVLGATSPDRTTAYSKMVPTVMAAIDWARAAGCATFDLGGIPLEDDPDEKRKSIAQFKFYFAKEPVVLVREHVRVL